MIGDLDPVLAAGSPVEASRLFYARLEREGATYLQTRLYRRPEGPLTSDSHFAAGGVVLRMAPAEWPQSEAFRYVCFDCNPLLTPIREQRTRYAFSDFAPRSDTRFDDYWDALGEARVGDALCATSYGEGGMTASLHLGFETAEVSDDARLGLQLAGLMLTERLIAFGLPPRSEGPSLTQRERDALGFVAAGKTDWEISVILGVSEATARFHVDNGRRKLGAVTRAQAVAKLATMRMI